MERERGSKVIAIVALVAAVVGMSLGFASFSQFLTISTEAEVKPDNDGKLRVQLSNSSTTVPTGAGTLNISEIEKDSDDSNADSVSAIIINYDNDDASISNIKAKFTEPGQSITYKVYAHNTGKFDAFLRSVSIERVETGKPAIVCTPIDAENTTDAYVQNACKGMSISVKVGDEDELKAYYHDDAFDTTVSKSDYSNHVLNPSGGAKTYEEITIVLTYDGTDVADGDFTVNFGDIKITYSTVDGI